MGPGEGRVYANLITPRQGRKVVSERPSAQEQQIQVQREKNSAENIASGA